MFCSQQLLKFETCNSNFWFPTDYGKDSRRQLREYSDIAKVPNDPFLHTIPSFKNAIELNLLLEYIPLPSEGEERRGNNFLFFHSFTQKNMMNDRPNQREILTV